MNTRGSKEEFYLHSTSYELQFLRLFTIFIDQSYYILSLFIQKNAYFFLQLVENKGTLQEQYHGMKQMREKVKNIKKHAYRS